MTYSRAVQPAVRGPNAARKAKYFDRRKNVTRGPRPQVSFLDRTVKNSVQLKSTSLANHLNKQSKMFHSYL